jgi:hypothetical protein
MDTQQPNTSGLRLDARPRSDVDELLRGYFRAEMPEPWPACPTPERAVQRPSHLRITRWVVAASVGLLLVGYLTLAGFFPRPTGHLGHDPSRNIGMKKDAGRR